MRYHDAQGASHVEGPARALRLMPHRSRGACGRAFSGVVAADRDPRTAGRAIPAAVDRRRERKGSRSRSRASRRRAAIEPGLFPIRSTGVSTEPVSTAAADAFLAALTTPQRDKTMFAVDDVEWRKWMNQHFYVRQGVSFHEMTDGAARGGVRRCCAPSLSAKGLKQTRDIMRLNHTLGELNDNDFDRVRRVALSHHRDGHAVGDRAVGLAARRPSRDHQLLRARRSGRDDAVLRRLRAGRSRTSGKYKGTAILQDEQDRGPRDDQRARRAAAQQGDPRGRRRPATTT